jgi:hypothetical protein
MKIVFISPPFVGHCFIFHRLSQRLKKESDHLELHLIYLTWKNLDMCSMLKHIENSFFHEIHQIVNDNILTTTDPVIWCEQQRVDLMPQLIDLLHDINPETIVYDAFSWVYTDLVTHFPKIRFISSLSGFLGPEIKSEKKYKSISDGFYQECPINIIWAPSNVVSRQVNSGLYYFMGYILPDQNKKELSETKQDIFPFYKKRVLVSLGTVIQSKYMWDKNSSVRKFVTELFTRIVKLSKSNRFQDVEFIMVTNYIDHLSDICGGGYRNVLCRDFIDQYHLLSEGRIDLLVTHGGNNSVQEALMLRIPMLIIPFFGDQHDTAEWVTRNELGKSIGLSLEDCENRNTNSCKDRSLDNLESYIYEMIHWKRGRFYKTSAISLSPYTLLCDMIPFRDGDILLGCNEDRSNYIKNRQGYEYFGFSETPTDGQAWKWMKHRKYGLLLDNYTDVLKGYFRDDDVLDKSHHHFQLVEELRAKLPDESDWKNDIVNLCFILLDFILEKGFQLHFIFDKYAVEKNFVTRFEFLYILRSWNHKIGRQIHFYKTFPVLHPINIYDQDFTADTIQWLKDNLNHKICYCGQLRALSRVLCANMIKSQYRGKSISSILNNLKRSNELDEKKDCFHDLYGYRLFTLGCVTPDILSGFFTKDQQIVFSENNHAVHIQLDDSTELQIWSLVIYAGLQMEHDTVYKSHGFVTESTLETSQQLRALQHKLQYEIEKII